MSALRAPLTPGRVLAARVLAGLGQALMLRARFADKKIRGINKTDGLTWKVKEILERAKENVATGMRQL